MKFLKLIFLSLLLTSNAWAWLGNTNNGTLTDTIGTTINVARFTSSSNMIVDTIFTKVSGSGGKYKCAIYSGDANGPSTFVAGTSERNASTNGWYSFALSSNVTLQNGNYYWLAVWSDNANSYVFYTTGGTVRWISPGTVPYSATWPNTLTTIAGTAFNYCIYAQDVIVPPTTNQPPVISTNKPSVTLAWDASPDATVVGYRIYVGIASRSYTNSVPVGNVLTATITNLAFSTQYYYTATAYDANGFESVYCNEVSYATPAPSTNNVLSAPVILYINQSK